MATKRKTPLTKVTDHGAVYADGKYWNVRHGRLKRGKGHPGKTEHLFKVVGEKLPFVALSSVKKHFLENRLPSEGVYIAHDSMGCPRYIGRGNIFNRLTFRQRLRPYELVYFSFFVVSEKKHEREIETLLLRAAGFLLEFNERKKQVGVEHGNVRDFEAGTLFYERQKKKGKKA
jgi:hypothetical protein